MMLPDANAMLDSKMIMMAKILEPWESSATAVFHSTIQVKSLKLAMMELKIELCVPVCENCVQQMVLGQLYNRASLHMSWYFHKWKQTAFFQGITQHPSVTRNITPLLPKEIYYCKACFCNMLLPTLPIT